MSGWTPRRTSAIAALIAATIREPFREKPRYVIADSSNSSSVRSRVSDSIQ